jgi:hypothetical protein
MKRILIAIALLSGLMSSCKKEEIPCYTCQWIRQGRVVEQEERCGEDVPSWALTVRMTNPAYFPVCSRK